MDFGNIVTLYDEDGNEIKFEIIEQAKFCGKEYFLLWGEVEEDVFVVVTKNNGDYEVVDDDEVIEHVRNKFRGSMSDLQSVAEGDMTADDFMKMNPTEAQRYATTAVEDEKDGEAQLLYAKCLENGFGCIKDKKSAKQYYQLVERNGYVSTEKPKKRFGFF